MKNRAIIGFFFFLSAALVAQGKPKIWINEFLASNVSTNADIVDHDDYSDWIELYNDESIDVDIGGYYITDNPNNPDKWEFPDGTPLITPESGFYAANQSIQLNSESPGEEIRFNRDGSKPIHNSESYETPIELAQTNVVSARILGEDKLPVNMMWNGKPRACSPDSISAN